MITMLKNTWIIFVSFLVLFIFVSRHLTAQCTYTFTEQNSGTTAYFYSIKAVDGNVGWAAGSPSTIGTTPIIRRTVNGGLNWTDANPNPGVVTGEVYNIEAIDSLTAWCTTSPASTFIYKTTNGGQSWSVVFQQAGGFIDAIKMQTPLNGYAIGDPVGGTWTILTTANGGLNWTQLPTAPPRIGSEASQQNSAQIMLPHIWFGTTTGKVYHSSNAGATWVSSISPGNGTGLYTIRFNTPANGLVSGDSLTRSTNGGISYSPISSGGAGVIDGIGGNYDSTYIYCRTTTIYYSSDNGNNFTPVYFAPSGTYNYMDLVVPAGESCLKGWALLSDGKMTRIEGSPNGIQPISNMIPASFSLSQNYPNPFNPTTNFNFSLPKTSFVAIKIYDVVGKEVAILSNETRQAGTYKVEFDASNLSSGVYFYSIQTSGFTDTKKMVLLK